MILLTIVIVIIVAFVLGFNYIMPFISVTIQGYSYAYQFYWKDFLLVKEQWLTCKDWATGAFYWNDRYYLITHIERIKLFKRR